MTIDLSGRKILVTGAGRGIGQSIAEALLDAGAHVVVHYRTSASSAEELARRFPGRALPVQADLADHQGPRRLFDASTKALGGLDALVNNAGIAEAIPTDADDATWRRLFDRTIAVNLAAAAQLSRLSAAHFSADQGGRIVAIASRAAFRGDTPEFMVYAASKAGLVAHTRSIARAYGKQGVCAFVVAPGWVRTDMAADAAARYGEAFLNDGALDRLTEPADVAPLVVLLVSGKADHATGTTIDVNAASYVH